MYNNMNNDIIIPYKYSFVGHFTSLYILIPMCLSYKLNNYIIYLSCLYLYITTNLHWFNVKEGFIKKTDMSAVGLFSIITAIETYKKYQYFYLYWIISFINIYIFKYNKYTNYKTIIYNIKNKIKTDPIIYMELVTIHVLTLHIGQMMALYFVLNY